MRRQRAALVAGAILIAVSGCSGSQAGTGASSGPAHISSGKSYPDAKAVANAMSASGVACESEKQVETTGTQITSQVSCDGVFGTLGIYQFAGVGIPNAWLSALKVLCGNPAGDEYVAGANWAILPTDLRGNSNTEALAAKLGLTTSHLC